MSSKDTKKENLVKKEVMLSKEDVKKISSIAESNNVSFSHVLRNAIKWYDADFEDIAKEDEEMFSDLVLQLEESTKRAEASIDKGHRDFQKMLKRLGYLEQKL